MAMPDFDILIKNAQVVDGTGAPPFRGAIAVEGGRIAAVGRVEGDLRGDAEVVIDAGGLAVTPGFIDVHNHGDLSILYYPGAEGFLRQGITTFVGAPASPPVMVSKAAKATADRKMACLLFISFYPASPDQFGGGVNKPMTKG
jgi:N-acyl-D-amino-acid deacylase